MASGARCREGMAKRRGSKNCTFDSKNNWGMRQRDRTGTARETATGNGTATGTTGRRRPPASSRVIPPGAMSGVQRATPTPTASSREIPPGTLEQQYTDGEHTLRAHSHRTRGLMALPVVLWTTMTGRRSTIEARGQGRIGREANIRSWGAAVRYRYSGVLSVVRGRCTRRASGADRIRQKLPCKFRWRGNSFTGQFPMGLSTGHLPLYSPTVSAGKVHLLRASALLRRAFRSRPVLMGWMMEAAAVGGALGRRRLRPSKEFDEVRSWCGGLA